MAQGFFGKWPCRRRLCMPCSQSSEIAERIRQYAQVKSMDVGGCCDDLRWSKSNDRATGTNARSGLQWLIGGGQVAKKRDQDNVPDVLGWLYGCTLVLRKDLGRPGPWDVDMQGALSHRFRTGARMRKGQVARRPSADGRVRERLGAGSSSRSKSVRRFWGAAWDYRSR
jgi:hypothetical protein